MYTAVLMLALTNGMEAPGARGCGSCCVVYGGGCGYYGGYGGGWGYGGCGYFDGGYYGGLGYGGFGYPYGYGYGYGQFGYGDLGSGVYPGVAGSGTVPGAEGSGAVPLGPPKEGIKEAPKTKKVEKSTGEEKTESEPQTAEEQRWLKELLKSAKTPQDREDLQKEWQRATHQERREYYNREKSTGSGKTKSGGKGTDKGEKKEDDDTDELLDLNISASPASLLVHLPENATVTINGFSTTSQSGVRLFVSPPLPFGREFYYTLVATAERGGTPLTVTRQVAVRAGSQVEVDLHEFSNANAVAQK